MLHQRAPRRVKGHGRLDRQLAGRQRAHEELEVLPEGERRQPAHPPRDAWIGEERDHLHVVWVALALGKEGPEREPAAERREEQSRERRERHADKPARAELDRKGPVGGCCAGHGRVWVEVRARMREAVLAWQSPQQS